MHQKPGSSMLPTNSISNVNISNIFNTCSSGREHQKFDDTISDSAVSIAQAKPSQANSGRYKTEMCRPFEESGTCKYGDKCQFAHGMHELRTLTRHKKYKTELCRTFHTTGLCPYGSRCHFIHYSEEARKTLICNLQVGLQTVRHQENFIPTRPKALSLCSFSLGSAGDLSPMSSVTGSPTSLNIFFNDDTYGKCSPTPPVCSFSQDFTKDPAHNLLAYGGSQPVVFTFKGLTNTSGELVDSYVKNKVYPTGPTAPLSPVDSLTSEFDRLSVSEGFETATFSSLHDVSHGLPRLPIFSRLASFD
ncbi:mRNA decay activator protein ZFP36L1-like [Limulus polyphemus]|uniref:mRNA decay activator protein ZFP36L1-like n=1 Tax=Limulus polyphemus TaxID=6850 RepID=A0ABM1BGV2_LIMPO|nr:mRNA decay activator protein ZFP36L1-like [Limulus polyphemus]